MSLASWTNRALPAPAAVCVVIRTTVHAHALSTRIFTPAPTPGQRANAHTLVPRDRCFAPSLPPPPPCPPSQLCPSLCRFLCPPSSSLTPVPSTLAAILFPHCIRATPPPCPAGGWPARGVSFNAKACLVTARNATESHMIRTRRAARPGRRRLRRRQLRRAASHDAGRRETGPCPTRAGCGRRCSAPAMREREKVPREG